MRIKYPTGFDFETMLGQIILPSNHTGSFVWNETYVEIENITAEQLMAIKKELHRLAGEPFDEVEENKTVKKQKSVREWLKSSKQKGLLGHLKSSPNKQKTSILAMNENQRTELLWQLSVLASGWLRHSLEGNTLRPKVKLKKQ